MIAQVTPDETRQMKEFLDNTEIRVEHVDNGITFDIIVTLYKGDSYAKVRIANYHTNIVLIEKNGEILKQVEVAGEEEEGLTDRSLLNMEDIWDFINTVDIEDIREVLTVRFPTTGPLQRRASRGITAPISALFFWKCLEMTCAPGQRPWQQQVLTPG